MKRLSLAVLVVILATGVLGQVSLKSTAPPAGGGGGGLAFQASSVGPAPGAGPIVWDHTVTGTDNTLLVATVMAVGTGTASTCTYNSVSMNQVLDLVDGGFDLTILQLVAPTAGTHSVSCANAAGITLNAGVMSFTGAHQTTPIRGSNTNTGASGGASSVTVSSATGDIVVDGASTTTTGTMAADASQSQQYEAPFNGSDSTQRFGASTKPGAASVTMQWTFSGGDPWRAAAVSIQPAP